MSESKVPDPQNSHRWVSIYLAVAVNAVAMIVLLWLFSRAFS